MAKLLNNKWVFTDDEIDEQIDRGKKLFEEDLKGQPVATSFKFYPVTRILSIRSKDGSRIDFPVSRIKELRTASDKEIRSAYITRSGDAIHWDSLNAHYTVAGLAANIFGTKEWMRELAKIGGSKTSPAKSEAARLNGQKGGRPPVTKSRRTVVFHSQTAAVGHAKNPASKAKVSGGSAISQIDGRSPKN